MSELPPAFFIMGPTASGKTELAVKIVQELPCEIISVDSAMVYRQMDIGTAKPDAETLRVAPHRLIDICDPKESYSAAQFVTDSLQAMAEIQAKGLIPVLVGGTFLYFRALEQGLSPLPSADEAIREQLEEQAQRIGWQAMHAKLAQIDPPAAQRIHANDPQRIQRALEVYYITGKPISAHFKREKTNHSPFRFVKIALAPQERTELHKKIEQRFKLMLEMGLIEEVEALYRRGDLSADLPSMRAVGYRQVWQYLEGKWDYNTMQHKAVVATRQYAKRQFTWLRAEPGCHWYNALQQNIHKEVLKKLETDVILTDLSGMNK
ncbi:tRNA (adenosine(37)-N6)-dimethylallyltransferase MiaA [Kaarinaea lacus]